MRLFGVSPDYSIPRSANALACRVVENMSTTRLEVIEGEVLKERSVVVESGYLKVWRRVSSSSSKTGSG